MFHILVRRLIEGRVDNTAAIYIVYIVSKPGQSQGCSTNTTLIDSVSHPLPPLALQRRQAKTAFDGAGGWFSIYVEVSR